MKEKLQSIFKKYQASELKREVEAL